MAERRVHIVHIIDYETGGHATTALEGLPVRTHYRPTELPEIDEIAGLVILGGAASAADEHAHPYLEPLRRLCADAVAADVPVWGLCLGHQILARALGAEHRAGVVREIGFSDVEVVASDPWLDGMTGTLPVIQWHSDEVSLPPGATLVATGGASQVQAFRLGSAFGTQFHLEVDQRVLDIWTNRDEFGDLVDDVADVRARFAAATRLHDVAMAGFGAFAGLCRRRL